MRRTLRSAGLLPAVAAVMCAAAACSQGPSDDSTEDESSLGSPAEVAQRCATRISIAFTGRSASPAQLAMVMPQDAIDGLLTDPAFIERFARFANSRLNPQPGENAGEDASYHLAKYVLQNGKPFKDLFVGPYNVDAQGLVAADPNGLGYFRSRPWMVRYAGNELAGYRLVSAYRILQNTTGLKLIPTTNVAGGDLSATGRTAFPCNGCHFNGWSALDKVARVLSKRQGTGANMTFTAPTDGPQQILGNMTISNDKELVTALVASDHFKFNACRHAFNFLYGRDENSTEAATFDKCVDALTSQGTIQAALAAVAKDPSFCQ